MTQDTGSNNPFDGVVTLFDNLGDAINRGAGIYKNISDLFKKQKNDPVVIANTKPGQPALNTVNYWPYVWAIGGITGGAVILAMILRK
jgi:hypothetical protein